MTDNELLLAMSDIMDKKLEPVNKNIQEMKGDIQEMRGDIQEIKDRVKKIQLTQENNILPRLQNIESCYTSTYDRYKDNVETYTSMEQDISIMKKVLTEHSKKLQNIS